MNSTITSQDSVLDVVVKTVTDPAALAVLLATVVGFILPMLWIYPPVAPRPSDFLNETHTKLGQGWSRIDDASSGPAAPSPPTPTTPLSTAPPAINSLWIYPIKSCAGIQVQRARVLPLGFEFDRLFTFAQLRSPFPADAGEEIGGIKLGEQEGVAAEKRKEKEEQDEDENDNKDEELENWDFITQRQFPLLAALQVELWQPDLAKVRRAQAGMRADYRAERNDSMGESYVVLRYPWAEPGWAGRWAWAAAKLARGWRAVPEVEVVLPLSLPADDTARAAATYGRVRIWRDTVRALDLSAELPRSLQLYLGVSNRLGLLRIDPDHLREIYRNAPRKEEAGYQPVTGFQDAVSLSVHAHRRELPTDMQKYPVHLLNRSSVRHLETVTDLDETLPDLDERRFRANIIGELDKQEACIDHG